MVILRKPETATNVVDYEISGNKIYFGDDELMINLAKKERDDAVHIDICSDYTGGLVIGTGGSARAYVAEIDIPPRQYVEVEGEEGTERQPVPFDIDTITLTLWEMEV